MDRALPDSDLLDDSERIGVCVQILEARSFLSGYQAPIIELLSLSETSKDVMCFEEKSVGHFWHYVSEH